ncbi:head GIN domain-containing protein [Aquimarina gracilis]|uniref:Head GIN domain-containing protein n=1 Tax=Aquimarina gracilis TaxID=874422 RepID=A0ABU6A2S5_9FLAO|nr:head GIN domain-containing protein [Aquimarina gracilis]MEB3348350.1 head GIN domain-containing protein [Aquimarina gracilis]
MQITKEIHKILIFTMLSLFCVSTTFSQKNIKGNGNVIKQERTVSSFDEIIIKGVFNVHLAQGNEEFVMVEADENLQPIITVENQGNALVLGWKKGKNVRNKTKMNIYVTLKDIQKLKIEGVGSVKTASTLSLKKLKLMVSGVGNTALKLNCDTLDGNINALGTLTLEGNVDRVTLNNSGIGYVKAFDLIAKKLELNNSGIGKVEVYADETIDITSSGIGSVRYKGNAQNKNIDSKGLGKVTKVN